MKIKFILILLGLLLLVSTVSADKIEKLSIVVQPSKITVADTKDIYTQQVSQDDIIQKESLFKNWKIEPFIIWKDTEYSLSDFQSQFDGSTVTSYSKAIDKNNGFGVLIYKVPDDIEYKLGFRITGYDNKGFRFDGRRWFLNDTLNIDFNDMINLYDVKNDDNGTINIPVFIPEWNEETKELLFSTKGSVDADPTISLTGTSNLDLCSPEQANPQQDCSANGYVNHLRDGSGNDLWGFINVSLRALPDVITINNATIIFNFTTSAASGNIIQICNISQSPNSNISSIDWNGRHQCLGDAASGFNLYNYSNNVSSSGQQRVEITNIIIGCVQGGIPREDCRFLQKPFTTLLTTVSIDNAAIEITYTLNNQVPTLSNPNINVTNTTFFITSKQINASVDFNETDNADRINATAILFVNRKANLTYQLPNNYVPNRSISIVFNKTNITIGDVVNVQWNISDGTNSDVYANSSAVTVSNGLTIQSINFKTLNNSVSSPIIIYQLADYFNVNITEVTHINFTANISIISPSGIPTINNKSLGNNTADNFTYNSDTLFNETGNYIVRIFANNGLGLVQSSINLNVSSPIIRYNLLYNTSGSAFTSQFFLINLTIDNIGLRSMNGILLYNNSLNQSILNSINSTSRELYNTIILPLVTSPSNKEFYFNLSFDYGSNIFNANSSVNIQTINPTGFKVCSGGDLLVYNFTIRHEVNDTILTNGTFEATFVIYSSDPANNGTINITLNNLRSYPICLIDNSTQLRTNSIINYYQAGYDPRQYYLTNASVTNMTNNISLYLLEQIYANGVTFSVTDQLQQALIDRIIKVERYIVGENRYKLIAMGKTNKDGQYIIFLRLNDAFHKVTVEENNTVVFTTQELTQFLTTTYNIIISPNSVANLFKTIDGVTFTTPLSYINASKTFTVSYSDTSGKSTEGCLIITQIGIGKISQTCTTGSSGTLFYSLGNRTGEFIATFTFQVNPLKAIASLSIVIASQSTPDLTEDGWILGILLIVLIGTFGGLYVNSLNGVLFGFLLGLWVDKFLYLIPLPNYILIIISLIGIGIALLVRSP